MLPFVTLVEYTPQMELHIIIPTEIVQRPCKAWTILIDLLKQEINFKSHIQKKSLVHFFVFVQFLISVCGQPLDRPPEGFPCGTTFCTRWGFHTCITSSSKPYCLPCDHDQLPRHCGTKDEYPGCSLYCADLATNELKTKLEEAIAKLQRSESNMSSMAHKLNNTAQNLTITTSGLHEAEAKLTDTTQKLQHTMQNLTVTTQLLHHADLSQRLQQTRFNLTETEQALTRTEIELHSCRKEKVGLQQMNTTLKIVTAGIGLASVLLIVVCKVRREKRPKQDVKISKEVTSEETSLMTASDNSSNCSEKCIGDEDKCYGKQKLTNVQPTNAPGKSELAYNKTSLQSPNPNVDNCPNPP